MMQNNQDKFKNVMMFGRTDVGTPLVKEYFNSHSWISFGVNNDFPQELIRLYQNSSPLHAGLVDRKVDMVAGNGFTTNTTFIQNAYSRNTLNDIAKMCAYDKVLFGGFYLNIILNSQRTAIVQIEHIPYEKMRVAKYNADKEKNEYQLNGFYMSKDWMRYRRKENTPVFLPDYNQDFTASYTREQMNVKYPSQVMFFKTYTPGLDYYTLPSYNSALNQIKLCYEISTYHLKNVQNGFMPGMIIVNKSGIPTADERDQINAEMKARFAGADNAGDFIIVYAESDATAPTFTPVQLNSTDQRFKDLSVYLDDTLMRVHKFTSAIAGIEVAGKLGTSSEIEEALQYMQSTVISPLQLEIETAFNKIAAINGTDEKLSLNKYNIFNEPEDTTTPITIATKTNKKNFNK